MWVLDFRQRAGTAALRASALAAFALLGLAPSAASAWNNIHGTLYTLKVVAGETTLPEYPVSGVSATAEVESGRSPQVAVSIVHNGITQITSSDHEGEWGASISPQAPETGETVVLESPVGHTIGSVVYDGMPTIDPTTCIGSANFEGENTAGYTVEGSYVVDSLVKPYHHSPEKKETGFQQAQVKTLTGTSFGGNFVQPIPSGATVSVTESLKTPLSSEETFLYESERLEPANKSCPAPAPPPPPAPVVTPLQGSIARLLHATILTVLKRGWRDHVSINQAGTVTQDLFLRDGKLPAHASRASHHKTPPALLLARASATATGPTTLSLDLKLTKTGRRKLSAAHRISAILLTTLHTAGGQVDTLPPHSVTLKR